MKANPDDQLGQHGATKGLPVVAIQIVVVLLVAMVMIWFWFDQEPVDPVVEGSTTLSDVVRPAPVKPAPDVPRQPLPVADVTPAESPGDITDDAPVPVAPVDGDAQLREVFVQAGADALLQEFLSDQRPLEISAALIDGTSWGAMLRKILPANPPEQAFGVDMRGDQLFMSTSSYVRYDVYADSIEALDTDAVVQGFHRLRPLYEAAYEALGLDPEDFDNAVVRTLDRILATPEIEGPVALEHNSVLYQFADPKLENLPELQKQMLRMGPQNMRRIKLKAQALRDGLLEN